MNEAPMTPGQKLLLMRKTGAERLREFTRQQVPMSEQAWLNQVKLFEQTAASSFIPFWKRWTRR